MTAGEFYQIKVRGYLDPDRSLWFDNLTITHEQDGDTVLSGRVPDQAALHALLVRVRDLGLPLVAVLRLPPDDASKG